MARSDPAGGALSPTCRLQRLGRSRNTEREGRARLRVEGPGRWWDRRVRSRARPSEHVPDERSPIDRLEQDAADDLLSYLGVARAEVERDGRERASRVAQEARASDGREVLRAARCEPGGR